MLERHQQYLPLTTSIETVPATGVMLANSTVAGVINGAGSTFQTGDIINGNATSNAAVTIAAASGEVNGPLVQINALNNVTFRTLAAAPINATLFNNVGTITSNLSTAVLAVNNGALATNYALSNTVSGNADGLNVGLRAGDITGASNTINFSVTGVGTAGNTANGTASVDSALTSASTGVEGIAVATTGTNFFTVGGATAAATDSRTLAITGAGINTIDARGMTQANSFNLSGSTGTNTLRLDNVLTSGSTVTGGTGADTLRVAPTGGNVVANLNVSAVETLRLGTGSTGGSLLFAAAPNFSTVRVDGDNAEGTNSYTLGTVGSFATLNFKGDGITANAGGGQEFVGIVVNNSFAGAADSVAIRLDNSGTALTGAAGYLVDGAGGTGVVANGVETFNVTFADTIATSVSVIDSLTSNTLQSVSFSGLGSIIGTTINAAPVVGNSALTTVNLSGLTSENSQSAIQLLDGSVGAGTTVTASTGGTILQIGVEAATDTIVFNGGAGNDVVNSSAADGVANRANYLGTLVANLGGGTNILNTGTAAGVTVAVTSNTVGATNTINTNTANLVNLVATATSTNTVVSAAVAATRVSAAGSTIGVTLIGNTGTDTLVGGNGNDTITGGGASADRLTGGTGNDRFVISTDAYSVIQSAATGNLNTNAIQVGTTFAFANGVDIITDFATGDTLAVIAGGGAASTTLIGVTNAADQLTAATNFSVRGNFVGTTFTVAADGADMLFTQGVGANGAANRDIDSSTNYQVLLGFGATAAGNTIAAAFLA